MADELQAEVAKGWDRAVRYYRARGGVVFVSDCPFWGRHGFVQQSLARALAAERVPVLWLDGMDWRPRRPVTKNIPLSLEVRQLFSFPGRRFTAVNHIVASSQAAEIRRRLSSEGKKSVLWIQSGLPDVIAEKLPYVDVYSVFDDPTRNHPQGALCQKAKLVFCQNRNALDQMQGLGQKVSLALPPMDLAPVFDSEKPYDFPKNFPEKVMGYIGSFGSEDFDFVLFENLVHSLPDYGFILAGRTNLYGMGKVEEMKSIYPNFHYVPWVPREQLRAIWERINVSLLLYRGAWRQNGAFATKILESVFFGAGCVATVTPKTEEIGRFFPRVGDLQSCTEAALKLSRDSAEACEAAYRHFAFAMDPKLHLIRVADDLAAKD